MDSLILGLRVLVSLAAVLGLMWLLHRRLRRGAAPARAKALAVVSRQAVGAKASVVLVETDGRRFLLGVTEHGISVLHTAEAGARHSAARETGDERTTAVLPLARAVGAPDHESGLPAVFPGPETRRAARRAAAFDRELAGSILDLGTWRQAADALRTGRRR
ncbi:flagellar biosynthetic protein FliO [Sinomonas sp. JGH33]|uniref:Flagellar protein n=1 Tax=Sinomonas terricola TaxID=3110330 RepID=A0ABU5T523_9MICC|nr:flagellar biosynthetic protein FliO [Sinomonas sp. JGH33]MEA5454758.1 flagellar biosynthetic protein FliO [Sinomonas sp. JGH33]